MLFLKIPKNLAFKLCTSCWSLNTSFAWRLSLFGDSIVHLCSFNLFVFHDFMVLNRHESPILYLYENSTASRILIGGFFFSPPWRFLMNRRWRASLLHKFQWESFMHRGCFFWVEYMLNVERSQKGKEDGTIWVLSVCLKF